MIDIYIIYRYRYVLVMRVIRGDDEAAEFIFSGAESAERRKGKTGEAVLAVVENIVMMIIIFSNVHDFSLSK